MFKRVGVRGGGVGLKRFKLSRGVGVGKMELGSEGFKSGVGAKVVRKVGGLGSEEFGSRGQVRIRKVGGVGVWVWGKGLDLGSWGWGSWGRGDWG